MPSGTFRVGDHVSHEFGTGVVSDVQEYHDHGGVVYEVLYEVTRDTSPYWVEWFRPRALVLIEK